MPLFMTSEHPRYDYRKATAPHNGKTRRVYLLSVLQEPVAKPAINPVPVQIQAPLPWYCLHDITNDTVSYLQQMGLLVLIVGSSATSAHCIAEMNPEMK